jgi:glycosyltransferase involved in cell wall biosynthesis
VPPQVSICILSGHRPTHLEALLESLRSQADAPTREVLVAANADPGVAGVVSRSYPDATVVELERSRLGAARNQLARRAAGNLLLFLDDDVVAPRTLLRNLAAAATDHPDVDVFGGPNVTPPGSSTLEELQGAVLASVIGTGPVRRRWARRRAGAGDERSFTLCNLAVRRRVMRPFAAELTGGEENALLTELARQGRQMRYEPSLFVWHARRPTVRGFAAQMLKYGRGRGEAIRRDSRNARLGYLAPLGLLAYLGVLPLAVVLTPFALVPLGAYALAVAAGGTHAAARVGRLSLAPAAASLIVLMHTCYAIGLARGLLRAPRRRRGRSHHLHEGHEVVAAASSGSEAGEV